MIHRFLVLMLLCSATLAARADNYPASRDTAYSTGSRIANIWLHDNKVKELTNLGMLWGFIKYHHAGVNKGEYNMDVALFRVLPQVLAAANTDSANAVMERWVDGFGKPELCKACKPYQKTDKTKLEPDYGYLFADNNLPRSLRDKLEYIKLNRYSGDEHYYVAVAANIKNPEFNNEREYAAPSYPDAGLRLLALYRYWNMIQYYYPNRHLIGEDWGAVLQQMIPDFCNATDATEYQLACVRLTARINDTHAGITRSSDNLLNKAKGNNMTPFAAQFVEDKLIAIGYYKDTLGIKELIKPGDVIERIDGVSILDLIRRYLPLTPASNYEKKLSNMARSEGYLLRSDKPQTKLTIVRDDKPMEITVPNIKADSAMVALDYGTPPEQGYKMLDGNIGYIYPAKLTEEDYTPLTQMFENTRGIIIDMRCYPTVFMPFNYGKWLKPESSPFVQITNMNIDVPGAFEYNKMLENGGGKGKHYKGKVVILVNARTQSTAEYQTMALQTAPGAKVIGSQTSGADGDVSPIVLPGGVKTMISGVGILYPDGTESQRAGVKIDKEVRPTIKGIKEGKDEVLAEAIRMLNE